MEGAARLKKLRLEKGLSLEEAQKKTKIHSNILKALEGDSLTSLSPVYLQGFLRMYCKFLGVDPKDYALDAKEVKRQKTPEVAQPKAATALKPATPIPAKPLASSAPETKKASAEPAKFPDFLKNASTKLGTLAPNRNVKKIIGVTVIALVFVFVVFRIGKAISVKWHARASSVSTVAVKKEQKATKTTSKATAAPSSQNAAAVSTQKITVAKKESSSEIRMVIKARENCWVTLKVDGKVVFHRVLEKGRSETWKAKERMDLALGNAGVVELEVDGQLFSNLGRKGQSLKNIVITKKGLDIGR